jgi:hypothetical protein
MFAFLNSDFHGFTVGTILGVALVLVYVGVLFKVAKPGSLRITRSKDEIRGSLRFRLGNYFGLRGSLRITRKDD